MYYVRKNYISSALNLNPVAQIGVILTEYV
jgi:hypothetical protein